MIALRFARRTYDGLFSRISYILTNFFHTCQPRSHLRGFQYNGHAQHKVRGPLLPPTKIYLWISYPGHTKTLKPHVANRPRFGCYSPVRMAQLYRVGWFSYPRDSSARQDQLNGWQVARRRQQGLLMSISICSLLR